MADAKKSSPRKLFLSMLGAVVLLLVAVGAAVYPQMRQRWKAPLGPSLDWPTLTPTRLLVTATVVVNAPVIETVRETAPVVEPATTIPTAAPTSTPAPLCGGPAVTTVLAVGADSGRDYLYGLGDVIRIARVDFVTPKVTVLSMPRDLWVALPPGVGPKNRDGQVEDVTHSKLNQTYFYGNPGMGYYDGPGAGPGLMARTLDLNFGLRVDHYGAVNMQTFVKIVDAVGGLDIYLPSDVDGRPIDDRTEDMGYFTAGQQHFTGDEALRFSRIRKKYNDFTRMDHQNMVICALQKKIVNPAVLPKIPQIIAAFQDSVLTDLSLEQIGQMACLLPHLERENILFTSLPEEIMQPGRVYSPIQKDETFIMEADFEVVREWVRKFIAGEWPNQPEEPTCP